MATLRCDKASAVQNYTIFLFNCCFIHLRACIESELFHYEIALIYINHLNQSDLNRQQFVINVITFADVGRSFPNQASFRKTIVPLKILSNKIAHCKREIFERKKSSEDSVTFFSFLILYWVYLTCFSVFRANYKLNWANLQAYLASFFSLFRRVKSILQSLFPSSLIIRDKPPCHNII